MKKVIISYLIYLLVIWVYFLLFYPLQTMSNSNYATLAHAVFFSKLPLEWILLYGWYKWKISAKWMAKIEALTRLEWLRTIYFTFLLVLCYGLIRLPFNLFWYRIMQREGTSRQPLGDWFGEMGLDLLLYWIGLSAGIYITRLLMARFKRAWSLYLWLIALPIALFVVYIQPVWIDPLYQDYTEMEEGPLRTKIEALVENAGLEDATLLQVNMSEKVTTFNAYVTGIFGNARIVVWDTTLEGMPDDEILFILAHEIGHYVKRHVYLGVAGYLLLSLVLFYLVSFIYRRIWNRLDQKQAYRNEWDLRVIPLLLLTLSILMTVAQPISMYVSRQIERSADEYAIAHTENLAPAIDSYQSLAVQSKSDVDPVFWVKWMRFSHPPIKERIELVEKELKNRETTGRTAS